MLNAMGTQYVVIFRTKIEISNVASVLFKRVPILVKITATVNP